MQEPGASEQKEGEIRPDGRKEELPSATRREEFRAERPRHAYLFRMWAEPRRGGNPPLWRFSLEEVESGTRHGFGSMSALVEFLQERMAVE